MPRPFDSQGLVGPKYPTLTESYQTDSQDNHAQPRRKANTRGGGQWRSSIGSTEGISQPRELRPHQRSIEGFEAVYPRGWRGE
jgi:hypothetical protein